MVTSSWVCQLPPLVCGGELLNPDRHFLKYLTYPEEVKPTWHKVRVSPERTRIDD